jgi:hypothetical protein
VPPEEEATIFKETAPENHSDQIAVFGRMSLSRTPGAAQIIRPGGKGNLLALGAKFLIFA